MKKKIIRLFEKHLEKLYTESRELLFKNSSYNADRVNFKNIHLFLSFLESSLEKPYNRLRTLSMFVNDPDGISTDLMYPFALLTSEAKKRIEVKEIEGIKLAQALDVSEIDENYVILWKENQMERIS